MIGCLSTSLGLINGKISIMLKITTLCRCTEGINVIMFEEPYKVCLSICNYIGPEHIEVLSKNFKKYLNTNLIAGSVCIGAYSSMALSDYGPTQHSLPTISSSKFSSGLGVKDFITQTSYNELSKKGVAKLGKNGILLSEIESLIGHTRSIKKRMEKK